jgi:hypothetical protein
VVVVVVVVMVVAAVMVVVMTPIVVIAAIVIPVALFHTPTVAFADVVGVGPVGAAIRRPAPVAADPAVMTAVVAPITVDPDVAVARHGGMHLNTDGRRRSTNVDMDLADGGCSHCGSGEEEEST